MKKYVCNIKGCYLSFLASKSGASVLIKENDVVIELPDNQYQNLMSDIKHLKFGDIIFTCDLKSFDKYFVDIAILRDKKIEEIFND